MKIFPPFLDGTTSTTPPEVLHSARGGVRAGDHESFDKHLQRTSDSSDPKLDDQDRDAAANAAPATVDRHDANQPDQDESPTDAQQDESTAATDDATHDQESDPDDAETADELLTSEAALPIEGLAPETSADGVSPESTLPVAESPGDSVDQSDGSTHSRPTETQLDTTLTESASAGEPELESGRRSANVEITKAGSATDEPEGLDPQTNLEEVLDATALPLEEEANPPGDARTSAKSGNRTERVEPFVVGSPEAVDQKQAARVVESVARALSAKRDASVEGAPEVETNSPLPATVDGKGDATPNTPQDRFAQQLINGGAERTARPAAASDINQTRFVDRVARAFRATEGQGGTIKLRLHPPELGVLQVQLRVQGNALTAKLEAETPAARALLIDSLPMLRDRLAEQGIQIEQFDVDLMERHPQNLPDSDREAASGEPNADQAASTEANDVADDPQQSADGDDNQQLNIIV